VSPASHKNILLDGPPRVGKTTVVQKVLSLVKVRCGGFFSQAADKHFYTNFRLVTVEGPHRVISDQDLVRRFDIPGLVGFNLEDLETRGNPSVLKALATCDVVVVDQLGTLEVSSPGFRRVVEQVLDSEKCCLATMTLSDEPFLDRIRRRADVSRYEVTEENRSTLPEKIARAIHALVLDRSGRSDPLSPPAAGHDGAM
jgi:nucleoside-triphosphatase THEP1